MAATGKLGKKASVPKYALPQKIDPTECPFREFRDNELSNEFWGLGPAALRQFYVVPKPSSKQAPTHSNAQHHQPTIWLDEQTQPLPRSVRHILNGWVRAEDLAIDRFESEVIVCEDHRMSVIDFQLSHAQVLLRSSFCRKILSACFILERVENLPVEHEWDLFNFTFGPEGWRAKYHIYSPGMKPGGGVQHRPTLSRNGCYLVRLYYLGAWRCVWVSDLVPVDASGAPLLPFSPLTSPSPIKGKGMPNTITSPHVHLWPLLICKAILKLAAPDMSIDEEAPENEILEDEEFTNIDFIHTLTGGFCMRYFNTQYDYLWELLTMEVKVFSWDEDDDNTSSTTRTKSTKKGPPKEKEKETTSKKVIIEGTISEKGRRGEFFFGRRSSMVYLKINDTNDMPSYALPGITPAYPMTLIVSMVRDVPIKKPLPEPEVPLWKHYRWVDWARSHGLYEDYDCPRTKFLKVNGLMKLSHAPHLLDVQSTESITYCFREQHSEKGPPKTKKQELGKYSLTINVNHLKEELREWIQYDVIQPRVIYTAVNYFPSMYNFTTAASNPPFRISKGPMKGIDIVAPKAAPLYLEIHGPEESLLKISLNILHPRVLSNCGVPIEEFIERGYICLESFEWFVDTNKPHIKVCGTTRGYHSVEVTFPPGRHFCRLWVHSRTNWHVALLSDSSLLLGKRDAIMAASVVQCDWITKFLNYLGTSFMNWIRNSRSFTNISLIDHEFYQAYAPDLTWDTEKVGYDKHFIHWMFRQALQSHLYKRMPLPDYNLVCTVLRKYFMDPDFGFPPKPKPPRNLRELLENEPCDCVLPEAESAAEEEEHATIIHEEQKPEAEEKLSSEPTIDPEVLEKLLHERVDSKSHICELATDDMPCGMLKYSREKAIKRHEAAIKIQAVWRGSFARKALSRPVTVTAEICKLLMEHAFGYTETMSALMNEFFTMFPGTNYAYSISSGLGGVYGLQQHSGVCVATAVCKWIPYFQGVFYCHAPVKAHFDVSSTLIENTSVNVYNNDTGEQLPQAFNAHITFDISPNIFGYTVLGHGSLNKPLKFKADISWQLTVLTSMDKVFHVCDNSYEGCSVYPLTSATKLHIDELYLPNRRNILGGLQISVTKIEAVSFRAATTMPNLEIMAVLRTTNPEGEIEEVARCHGKGEIFWPYIRLKPDDSLTSFGRKSFHSMGNLRAGSHSTQVMSSRNLTTKSKKFLKAISRSATKLVNKLIPAEPKTYTIEVTAPDGWALPIQQWKRIEEAISDVGMPKMDSPVSKPKSNKEKGASSAKDKKKEEDKQAPAVPYVVHTPLPEDAYTELECSTTVGGGAFAKRDEERDMLFANTIRSWEVKEPGRNARGAQIRQEFRDEYLVPPPIQETVSVEVLIDEHLEESNESSKANTTRLQVSPVIPASAHVPTPVTESVYTEMSLEMEEEAVYFHMPEALKDKFIPLYFVPLCMKEKSGEESVLMTTTMLEAAKEERNARLEAGLLRMKELQSYYELHVMGRQQKKLRLLSKLDVDHLWGPELESVLEQRDESIGREVLERQMSAAKKKLEAKQTQATARVESKRGKK